METNDPHVESDADASRALDACIAEFLRARQARKHAANTLAAYQRDLAALHYALKHV